MVNKMLSTDNLPNCRFCSQNNYREGDSYHGTHTERFYFCQTDKCMGSIQYFYCYRPFCVMFWRIEDCRKCFHQYKEISDWINMTLSQLRNSDGNKIATLITPYCMIWTWNTIEWFLKPINEKIEI